MDSAKVWLQTDSSVEAHRKTTVSSASRAAIVSRTGSASRAMTTIASPAPRQVTLRTLYTGVGAPLVTVGMVQSVNFAIYDSLRRTLHQHETGESDYVANSSMTTVALSSGAAGAVIACITNPLLVLKTKQQIMTWNFRQAFVDTFRQAPKRPLTCYVGFGPHFLMESLGRGLYVSSYEYLKRFVARINNRVDTTLRERMLCAGLSGVVTCAVCFPLDSLRSRLIAASLRGQTTNAVGMAKQMLREGGQQAFFRGLSVTMLRAGPVAAAVLPVYDKTLEMLSSQ